MTSPRIRLLLQILSLSLLGKVYGGPAISEADIISRIARHAKPPSIPTAPLDPNDNIHHTLDEINSILGTLGGASSQAVMGLTGISITDCALTIKEEDLSTITCAQFLDKLSQCDSLSHVKPLIQQAKQRYRKKPNARAPCFVRRRQG